MIYLAYTIHIVISLFLIMVVLLQQGKGADLSVFGGGGTQTAFGARGAATLLHKLTVWGFIGFIATTMSITLLTRAGGSGGSVMSTVPEAPAPIASDSEPAVSEPTATEPATTEPASAVEGDAVDSLDEGAVESSGDGSGEE